MKVAVLGPSGTYSHTAAIRRFPQCEPQFVTSLNDVVECVGTGTCNFGVLPVENSTNGVVDLAIKALISSPHRNNIEVAGDLKVEVMHQLYSTAKTLDTVKLVYSHPQVWGQTKHWLNTNLPYAKLISVESTSNAVSRVLSSKSDEEAAIGGPNSSSETPLVHNCCDNQENTTRFLILKNSSVRNSVGNRMHLILENTTVGEAVQKVGGTIMFVAAIPAKLNWKYDVYLDVIDGVRYGDVMGVI